MTGSEESTSTEDRPAESSPVEKSSVDGPADTADESDSTRNKLDTVGIAVGLGVGATLVSYAILLPLLFVFSQLGVSFPSSPLAGITLQLVVGQIIAMGGISAVYLWKTGRRLQYVKIRRPTLVESLVVVTAPFVVIFVTAMISQLSLLLGVEPSEHALGSLGDVDPRLYLYMVPLVILIVGPFEELLYRGVIQTRLRESFGPLSAILLASLVFAAIHIPAHGFGNAGIASTAASMAALVGGSLVFGGIYEWTENLTVVALIHGFYDAILLTVLYFITIYGPEIEQMAETATVFGGI